MSNTNVLKNLRGLRTQEDVAAAIGIDRASYTRIENGQRRPSPEVAEKIGRLFGLSIEDIWQLFYSTPEPGTELDEDAVNQ